MKEAIIKILEQNLPLELSNINLEICAIELEKLMDIRMSELWREKVGLD